MTSSPDLEARIAALEADRADHRAVLTAVGALGGRFDKVDERFNRVDERLESIEVKYDATREAINALSDKLASIQRRTREEFSRVHAAIADHRQETRTGFRSMEDQMAEIKDLIIDRLG
ncbi:hypothetical protein [Mycolicibacterium sp. XJ870]